MSTPEAFQVARSLAEKLVASSDGGRDYWDDLEELSQDERVALDSIAFECTSCNQWFMQFENASPDGEWTCKDCSGEG